jgi:hypothetical protein
MPPPHTVRNPIAVQLIASARSTGAAPPGNESADKIRKAWRAFLQFRLKP